MWNTYWTVKEQLDNQFTTPLRAGSGLPAEELKAQVQALVDKEIATTPRIILRAKMLSTILDQGEIRVDPWDLFAGHIGDGQIMWFFQWWWLGDAKDKLNLASPDQYKGETARLDLSHTSPDWWNVLKYGPTGLLRRAEEALATAKDDEAREFFTAVKLSYEAVCRFCQRLADEAQMVGATEVAQVLQNILQRPPQTLREALQWSFIYALVQEVEGEYLRSQGTFDQLYLEFYRKDLAEERLTRDEAKELLCFLFDKYAALHFGAGHNFCLGGTDENGQSLCNELTELCLEVFRERKMIDPKLSFRYSPNTPERFLRQACEAVREGTSAIVFANDVAASKMFLKNGKKPEDIRDFIPIGCYEPSIMGKELCCSMSVVLNLATPICQMLEELKAPQSMDEVYSCYCRLLEARIKLYTDLAVGWKKQWKNLNPSPILSGTMDSCFRKGRDLSNGGGEYSVSGVVCAGLATASDALAAIEYAVFQQHLCTWQELLQALAANWAGYESLRGEILSRAPKWGCNTDDGDHYGLAIAKHAAQVINHTPNYPDGHFQMGCWSIDLFLPMGKDLGATPDGRFAHDPISKNTSPVVGMARRGIPAQIHSIAKLDATDMGDGSVADITIHPSALDWQEGASVLSSLVRTFFQLGGFFMQFNILDLETLQAAQQHPEKYRDLQVRVCGWNALFSDLSKDMQDAFIRESMEV